MHKILAIFVILQFSYLSNTIVQKPAMGKSEERNGTTIRASEQTFFTKTSKASKMLEAALLQMDDIISGKLGFLPAINFMENVYLRLLNKEVN